MKKSVIFNSPVKNLDQSKAFFAALGFSLKPQFSNENAAFITVVDGAIGSQ